MDFTRATVDNICPLQSARPAQNDLQKIVFLLQVVFRCGRVSPDKSLFVKTPDKLIS